MNVDVSRHLLRSSLSENGNKNNEVLPLQKKSHKILVAL